MACCMVACCNVAPHGLRICCPSAVRLLSVCCLSAVYLHPVCDMSAVCLLASQQRLPTIDSQSEGCPALFSSLNSAFTLTHTTHPHNQPTPQQGLTCHGSTFTTSAVQATRSKAVPVRFTGRGGASAPPQMGGRHPGKDCRDTPRVGNPALPSSSRSCNHPSHPVIHTSKPACGGHRAPPPVRTCGGIWRCTRLPQPHAAWAQLPEHYDRD
jgi:hypothetical protein